MAHCNTLFHSMLSFIPRHQFTALEGQHSTGRKPRKFSRWSQFVHLMFMQLTGRASLRDGIQSMNSRVKNLYHLGVKPVARATFADANNMRPASFYEALFERIYQRCSLISPKHKFKFKNKLYSLDASVIDLSLGAFPWASFRRTKSAIKLHTLLDHSGYLPAFVSITEGKIHETKVATAINLSKGSIVVEDRAYTDYRWFDQLQQKGIFFVTRQKINAVYKVCERRQVNKKQGLCSDQTIVLTGSKGRLCPHPLRRIGYRDPITKKHYVFLTNNFKLSAKTIADIYKERWQI
ncbi:MAG: IS4 family transposase, partial [Desulfobulbia bacterium]